MIGYIKVIATVVECPRHSRNIWLLKEILGRGLFKNKNIYLAELPMELTPDKGLNNGHAIEIKPSTETLENLPYKQSLQE